MPDSQNNNTFGMFDEITRFGQKLTLNYFGQMNSYMEAAREICNVYVKFSNKMMSDPIEIQKVQKKYHGYLKDGLELSTRIFEAQPNNGYLPFISPFKGDKRFQAEEWDKYPYYFDFIKQTYLLFSQAISETVNSIDLDPKTKQKVNFFTSQYIDLFSPSNFIATNPEVMKLAFDTKGQSLVDGYKNLLSDIEKGRISQTDESAFEVGTNIAITEGAVVFENELIQLIQYSAQTENVAEYPILMIPPWINKYYILDLHPERSLVEFAVKNGHTVFMISWRNPTEEMRHITFNDYAELGSLKAIEVIKKITKAKKINTLGYCIGGTLLGISLAILKAKKNDIVNSATFLASMLDFSDIGPMKALIDEAFVNKIEVDLKDGGMLKGRDLAIAFNALRPNDLVWYYVINNYLKGKKPTPFSVLFWTNDNTNLPGKMYTYYLRKMLYENKLREKNALTICKVPIDLSSITVPAYIVGTQEDHIAPCRTAFITTEILGGPVEYVLGDSGHIMGAINAPSKKNKYHHHVQGKLGKGFEEWKKSSTKMEGSWWTNWNTWLNDNSGKQVPAPEELGNSSFPEIEPAPGSYVKFH